MQLLEISAMDIIAKGKSYISTREKAAKKVLDKALKIRLGRGFYGECLVICFLPSNLSSSSMCATLL